MHRFALSALGHGLRWQDAVDVIVLTALFSWAYRWLKHTIAVQVAFGLMTLLAVSWIASHLGLILTSYLFSAVSAVATIVIVVVFQHEIRRGLSRVNPLRWLTRRPGMSAPDDGWAIVAEAAFHLAQRRTGALLVLPRRDSMADLVTAGTPIDARLSVGLIEAIFATVSPLHDGAVVIAEERIARAAVILPLATEAQDGILGTRHRAAIGLARASDALIVCVSEQQGTVSLALGDAMEVMRDQAHLRDALKRAHSATPSIARPRAAGGRVRAVMLLPHVAILGGVVTAWAALALDRSHAIARIVPIEIRGVGDGLDFDPPRYTSIAVELRSSRRELELLPPDAVISFVDLAGSTVGTHTYRVVTTAPAGVEVVSETPSSIQMQIRPRTSTSPLPVSRATAATLDLRARSRTASHH
ncbi:MAG TPA: diadenylate cyclase [Polyangia bacterium]